MKRLLVIPLMLGALLGAAGCNEPDRDLPEEDGTIATAAGVPGDDVRTDARNRAEKFWRDRGMLGWCMDGTPVTFVRTGQVVTSTPDGGQPTNYTVQQIDAGFAEGCNTPGWTNENPMIYVNSSQRWSRRKLCVVYTHELGHQHGIPHLAPGENWNGKHYEIMRKNGPSEGIRWPHCQF